MKLPPELENYLKLDSADKNELAKQFKEGLDGAFNQCNKLIVAIERSEGIVEQTIETYHFLIETVEYLENNVCPDIINRFKNLQEYLARYYDIDKENTENQFLFEQNRVDEEISMDRDVNPSDKIAKMIHFGDSISEKINSIYLRDDSENPTSEMITELVSALYAIWDQEEMLTDELEKTNKYIAELLKTNRALIKHLNNLDIGRLNMMEGHEDMSNYVKSYVGSYKEETQEVISNSTQNSKDCKQ